MINRRYILEDKVYNLRYWASGWFNRATADRSAKLLSAGSRLREYVVRDFGVRILKIDYDTYRVMQWQMEEGKYSIWYRELMPSTDEEPVLSLTRSDTSELKSLSFLDE